MMKVYEAFPQINIKGEWVSCTMFGRTRAVSEETVAENSAEIFYNTFDELVKACESGRIVNAYVSTGFKGKPICHLSTVCRDFAYRITEKNFSPVGLRWDHREVKNPTFEYLMKYLPAENFLEWLAEKNISENFAKTLDKLREK